MRVVFLQDEKSSYGVFRKGDIENIYDREARRVVAAGIAKPVDEAATQHAANSTASASGRE